MSAYKTRQSDGIAILAIEEQSVWELANYCCIPARQPMTTITLRQNLRRKASTTRYTIRHNNALYNASQ